MQPTSSNAEIHDLVVVLPAILGSTLAREGKRLWAPSAGAVLRAITSFGGSVRSLTLPADIGDDHPGDGVEPLALMPDLHILPGIWTAAIGYGKLLHWLQSQCGLIAFDPDEPLRPANLLPVPYVWRLSDPHQPRIVLNPAPLAASDRGKVLWTPRFRPSPSRPMA